MKRQWKRKFVLVSGRWADFWVEEIDPGRTEAQRKASLALDTGNPCRNTHFMLKKWGDMRNTLGENIHFTVNW